MRPPKVVPRLKGAPQADRSRSPQRRPGPGGWRESRGKAGPRRDWCPWSPGLQERRRAARLRARRPASPRLRCAGCRWRGQRLASASPRTARSMLSAPAATTSSAGAPCSRWRSRGSGTPRLPAQAMRISPAQGAGGKIAVACAASVRARAAAGAAGGQAARNSSGRGGRAWGLQWQGRCGRQALPSVACRPSQASKARKAERKGRRRPGAGQGQPAQTPRGLAPS